MLFAYILVLSLTKENEMYNIDEILQQVFKYKNCYHFTKLFYKITVQLIELRYFPGFYTKPF